MSDIDQVSALLREGAERFVMPRWRNLADHEVMRKQGGELVTQADLDAEAWLTERLADIAPGSHVVGEEAYAKDNSILAAMADATEVWLIDPVDGTRNFARGRPDFAMMIAYIRNGETARGWIYQPASGVLAVCERGAGVRVDGELAPILAPAPAAVGQPFAGVAAKRFEPAIEAAAGLFGPVERPSCAGHHYVCIVTGDIQFSAYSKLMPWDHAPGDLMVREAGGTSARLDHTPYDPATPEGLLLSACDMAAWDRLCQALESDRT